MALEMPFHAHRFLAYPNLDAKHAYKNLDEHFTNNVQNIHLDLLNKKLTVHVRQTYVVQTFEVIKAVIDSRPPFVDLMMLGSDTLVMRLNIDGKLETHSMLLDYAEPGHLVHSLVWSFTDIRADLP